MGNTADITVVGDAVFIDVAKTLLTKLEQAWSRFISTSEICQLNNSSGTPVRVSSETLDLVRYLVEAHRITQGAFDPTLLPTLINLGYHISRVDPQKVSALPAGTHWTLPLSSIGIEPHTNLVTLPDGLTLDAGGLGKGFAADIVAQHLMHLGASGVCISLGGDIRCVGQSPSGDAWTLPIALPSGEVKQWASFKAGAIATSSVQAKTWQNDSGLVHHVIHPETKQPLGTSGVHAVQSTAIANEAVWAEVFSTAVLVRGADTAFPLCDAHNIAAQIVFSNGSTVENSLWKEFVQ